MVARELVADIMKLFYNKLNILQFCIISSENFFWVRVHRNEEAVKIHSDSRWKYWQMLFYVI